MRGLIVALVGMAMIALAAQAQAQTGRRLSLGAGLGFHEYVDSDFSQKNPGLSLVYRLAWKPVVKQGWTLEPKVSFDWFKTDVQTDVGTADVHIGKLRSIPVMAGAGPSYRSGRTKVGAAILVGPSFNHFTADKNAPSITVKNSLFLRPEAGIWYDVSSRLGLHAGVGYVYNRPKAETTSGATTTSEKWKTDHVNFSLGFAIGIL